MLRYRPHAHLLACCLAALSTAANGADLSANEARIARGRALAEAHCSACHAVGPADEPPARSTGNAAFRVLHERYPIEMLADAAKTGSLSGHDEMPGFDFPLADMTALLAYIDSLAPGAPGYVTEKPVR